MTVVSRQLLLAVVVLCLAYTWTGEAQTTDVQRAAHVLSVREVRHASLAPSRYPTPPQYTIDMAFSYSGQTYCTGYETPVLDEVRDLQAANGRDIQVEMHGKKLMVVLPSGRRLKAELVKPSQC